LEPNDLKSRLPTWEKTKGENWKQLGRKSLYVTWLIPSAIKSIYKDGIREKAG